MKKKTAWDNVHNIERILIPHKEAEAAGLSNYFTGTPCKYGHVTVRTMRGVCKECANRHNAKRTAAGKRRRAPVVRPAPVRQPASQPKQVQSEDRAILPADLTAPITDAERAYWAARPKEDGCLALLGKVIRQALADGDERGARRLCEALGLNHDAIANQAKKAKV